MKKQILLAFFFSFSYMSLNAQCNIPFPPALDCASAPVICDLDGYCTTTGGPNNADNPTTFCGSVQNNQWFAFVAGSANITLDFIVGICGGTGSGTGLQAMVYSMCGAPWTGASNCLYEISPGSTETLTLTNLTVGDVYYLMTDGFSGDMCDYTIEVTSGSTTPPVPDPAGPISGDAVFCPGASSVTYCAATSAGASLYDWTIPPGAVIVGPDNQQCITIDFSGFIGPVGATGTITATPNNGCESGDPSTYMVTQGPSPTGPDQNFILCPGETAAYGNTVYSTATNGTPFVNTDIANAQGCLIETLVYVEIGTEEMTSLVEIICDGETSSTGENSTGIYTYNLLTNYYGCDSTVSLDLTVLNPTTGIFPVTDEIDCSGLPITVSAVVTDTDPSITYVWSGPCFIQNFPQDPNISVTCGGEYEVYAEQTVGGVTCVSPTFTVIVNENTTPPTADPGLGGVIDCVNTTITLGGNGSSSSSLYAFSWTGPNGYNMATQYPEATEPGIYCFFMIDLVTSCISSTNCITVTGDNTEPIAVATASNNLDCIDITSTLDPTGSDPGTYTWEGPGNPTGSNPTVSMPGTYTLTVLSGNGCTSTQEVTITQDNLAPTASITAPAAIDCDNPTIPLDGSGSTVGVTYLWSNGETTSMATANMGGGTYTLTVTNISNGCTDEVSVTVDDNSTIVTADVDVVGQITCANGSVTLIGTNVVGSNNPIFTWSNGMSGQTITVGTVGPITLTVTDDITGCTGDVIALVTSDTDAPTAVAGVSGQLNCDDTSVVLSTAGSSTGGNISLSWSTTDPNNITTPGIYTLTITNTDNGCTATSDVDVTQDISAPVATILTPIAIDCNNTSILLDGGSSTGSNLSYFWAPGGGVGPTLNASAAGTYTLTVLNQDNGCTDTEEVTVIDNTTTVSVIASASNDLTCIETSATLDVSSSTGSGNPTYSWFDGTSTTAGSTLTTTIPGTYTLTLIDGTTGCQGTAEVTVLQDTNFPIASVATPNNLNCVTSSIILDGTSSTTGNNIVYSWLFNGSTIPGTDPLLTVSNAGDYQIVVTDVDNGCEVTSSIIPVILNDTPPIASAVAGNSGVLSCSATSLTIDGSASSTNSGNITFTWILNGNTVGAGSTYDVTTPGDYILEITDTDNGCTAQEIVVISPDADLPVLTIDPFLTLDCNNSSSTLIGNGSSNAGNTVTIEWQDASGTTVSTTDQYTTSVPGDYTFIVIDDGNGCSLSQLVTVMEDLASPFIDIAPVPIIDCNNTSIIVNASNSAGGANITYQWQDSMGNNLPLETNSTLTTGITGDYTFIVTDTDNGCSSMQLVNVPENIEAPVFDASALNNIDCNSIAAQLTSSITSSFSTDLSYEWTLGGTIIDTLPNFLTSNDGDFTVVVTDNQNGCSSETMVTVFNTIQNPTIVTNVSSNGIIDCNNPGIILDGTGSTSGSNFTYYWTFETDPTNVLSNDLIYTTMVPGTFVLTIIDPSNGCISTESVSVTQSIESPTSIVTSNTATLTCNNPIITLDGTSSSIGSDFTYQWYEIIGGISTEIVGADAISYDVNLEGTYELIVTDTENGCTEASTQVVIDQSLSGPTVVISNDGILTCTNNDVLLDGLSSTAGGTLEYEWTDANGIVTTGPELTVLTPGQVSLVITDLSNGCSSTDVFLVEEDINAPDAITSTGGTLLCSQPNILLDGNASSQNGNYTYEWWTFANGGVINMVESSSITYNASAPGDYVIIVTNTDNGCTSISAPVTVDENISAPVPTMTPSALVLTCDNETITFDAGGSSVGAGSSGTLNYEWIGTSGTLGNTSTLDVSTIDAVTLIITDVSNGCSTSEVYSTTQDIEQPSANAGSIQTLTCGTTQVTLDGASSSANGDPIIYAWYAPNDLVNVVETAAVVDASIPGTWTLLITNTDNGCTATSTVEVNENIGAPTAVVDFSGMLTCVNTELSIDGSNSTVQSSSGVIEYLWENGATTATTTFDAPGTYTVLITDSANDCTAEQSFIIEQDILEPLADIQAITSTTITCDEPILVFSASASNNNGNTNGGTLNYEWELNGVDISTVTPDQVEITQAGILEVLVTNINNGCTATFDLTIGLSDEVPIVNVPTTTPDLLTCIVDEVTIIATDNSPGNDNTYLWTGPGTIVGETTLTPTVSATGIYTLNVENVVSGCDISLTTIVNGDFEAPDAFAAANDQFDCVTFEVSLDGTNSATGPTISYEWSTVSGVIESGQNALNPIVSAPGDYTLLVTDNGNGCTSSSVVTVTANIDSPTIAGVQVIDPNCFGENNGSITLDNITGGQVPYLYSIDGGALAPINQFSFLGAGEYEILVQDANGCETNQLVTITDPQELLVELGDNQTIGLGEEFQLSAQIIGAYDSIMWSANCPDSVCANQPEFLISPLNTISYFVTVVDGNGCITTDQITINVEKGREVFIPNAFTPNGDGNNDRFWVYPGGEVAKVHEFRVFNRWGEQVFGATNFDPFTQDDTNGWDGTLDSKKMNPAVFVYYVDIEFIDGRREVLKGDVALRR